MSSTSDTPNADTGAVPAPGRRLAAGVQAPPSGLWVALALTVGAAGLGAAGWTWLRFDRLQQQLAQGGAEAQARVAAAGESASQASTLVRQLQARVDTAEARLAELSLQRGQLDELLVAASHSRDVGLLNELDAALQLALQQSQLTGSSQPLVQALQVAQKRMAKTTSPRWAPVQRALGRDLERLRAAAGHDVPALLGQLDDLLHGMDDWPLLQDLARPAPVARKPEPAGQPRAGQSPEAEGGQLGWQGLWPSWQNAVQAWWEQARTAAARLVRVSRVDRPEAALLAPEQAWFLRENLRLRLLNARLSLLAHQPETANADVQAAQAWLQRYFDARQPQVQAASRALEQWRQQLRLATPPGVDETLQALNVALAKR